MKPWEELGEALKESNRGQVDQISEKLRRIGCGLAPAGGAKPAKARLAAKEVEVLAEMEHERWMSEKIRAGWTLGPRDHAKKTSPYLAPWDRLPKKGKDLVCRGGRDRRCGFGQ